MSRGTEINKQLKSNIYHNPKNLAAIIVIEGIKAVEAQTRLSLCQIVEFYFVPIYSLEHLSRTLKHCERKGFTKDDRLLIENILNELDSIKDRNCIYNPVDSLFDEMLRDFIRKSKEK